MECRARAVSDHLCPLRVCRRHDHPWRDRSLLLAFWESPSLIDVELVEDCMLIQAVHAVRGGQVVNDLHIKARCV